MANNIYTKTGDTGSTGLVGGTRVSKSDLRVIAYGDVDELNACLGIALACDGADTMAAELTRLQHLLFELGEQLATPRKTTQRSGGVADQDVTQLESIIDDLESHLPTLKHFVLPSGTPLAAALHHARTVCRRAERHCVALSLQDSHNPAIEITFLNRLGDLLFVMARTANHRMGHADVLWQSRVNR